MKHAITVVAFLLIMTASLRAQSPAPGNAIHVIRGSGRVTDGWTSSDGKASFSDPELRGGGKSWGAYHRCLIRFDLASIEPSKYGRVVRAILRLHAREADNPFGP